MFIFGKRWFNRRTGNTYHSVTVYGKCRVAQSGVVYGYGDAYKQTAFAIAQKFGYTEHECYADFVRDENNTFDVADVARKREL